jgi:hypothetical protein
MTEFTASGPSLREDDFAGHLNHIFEVLAHEHRRYVLYCLLEDDRSVVTLDDLVDYVATYDANVTHPVSDSEREKLATELDVVHLPKLDDVGTIEYDRRSEMIRYDQNPSLEEWAEHAKHRELKQS